MNVLVLGAQVPFVRGGAEGLVDGLVAALRAAGHTADAVTLPFQWHPHDALFTSALAWRLLDLTSANGVNVDRVIATKFPSYAAQHPHKVIWLVHQLRQAYDWYNTPLSDFTDTPQDRAARAQLMALDTRTLGEAQARFAISQNVAARLKRFNALDATPLYPPPRLTGRFFADSYDDYVLYVGRLDRAKRLDLFLRAFALTRGGRAIIAGTGAEERELKQLAQTLGIADRVTFAGYVDDARVLDLYAHARAVYYAPVDEDYGFVTVEALMAARPVITTDDSGGVLEFIRDGENGWGTPPRAEAIAASLSQALNDPAQCRARGENGRECVRDIQWQTVVERLLS